MPPHRAAAIQNTRPPLSDRALNEAATAFSIADVRKKVLGGRTIEWRRFMEGSRNGGGNAAHHPDGGVRHLRSCVQGLHEAPVELGWPDPQGPDSVLMRRRLARAPQKHLSFVEACQSPLAKPLQDRCTGELLCFAWLHLAGAVMDIGLNRPGLLRDAADKAGSDIPPAGNRGYAQVLDVQ